MYFIEAKYKSHLYNKFGVSELLKDDYRRDLHQLLAYSSFNTAKEKTVFLCYPSTRVEIKETKYFNSGTGSRLGCSLPVFLSYIDHPIPDFRKVTTS